MPSPEDDYLYEVHAADAEGGPWRLAGSFDTLEEARIEAVHLITDTQARSVRVMHVVEYYGKAEPAAP